MPFEASFSSLAQGLAKNSDAFVEGMDEQLLHLFLGAMDVEGWRETGGIYDDSCFIPAGPL